METLTWVYILVGGWLSCGVLSLVVASFMPWELSGGDYLKLLLLGPIFLIELVLHG